MKSPSWEDLNEARAILYIIGYWYPEKTVPEAIDRRLHLLKSPITLIEFFTLIDTEDKSLIDRRKDELFGNLEALYRLMKQFKNLHIGGKWYLDEEKFVQLYNKFNPDKTQLIKERGKFDRSNKY